MFITEMQAQEWGQRLFLNEGTLLMSSAMPGQLEATIFYRGMLGRTFLSITGWKSLLIMSCLGLKILLKHCNKDGVIYLKGLE
jgi:hypothetical protein